MFFIKLSTVIHIHRGCSQIVSFFFSYFERHGSAVLLHIRASCPSGLLLTALRALEIIMGVQNRPAQQKKPNRSKNLEPLLACVTILEQRRAYASACVLLSCSANDLRCRVVPQRTA